MLDIELNKYQLFPEQELREKIAEHCEIRTFAKNDIVVREDEYIKVVPIVLTGKLRVFQTKELRQILLYYVEPYQTCVMSLSAGFFNLKSTSQAIALETTEALIIPTRFISQWQRDYNSWNEFVIRTFKEKYDELLVNYKSLAFDHLDKRLLDYLQQQGSLHPKNYVAMSHQQLANELGTTRVVISRVLKQFELNGKVKLYRSMIKVLFFSTVCLLIPLFGNRLHYFCMKITSI